MSDWVKKIFTKLTSEQTNRIIVVDPDGLFNYPNLRNQVIDADYDIYVATTALELRCLYELKVRYSNTKTIIVATFPYEPRPDMRQSTHCTHIGYRDIFPYFDARALKGLSYNALCSLNELHPYEDLGYDGTIRFLLENLYHVDLQALTTSRTKERFLAAVISIVFHPDGMNSAIKDYLYAEGRQMFAPLGKEIIEKESLLSYLKNTLEIIARGEESPCNLLEPLLYKAVNHLLTQKLLQPMQISKSAIDKIDQRLLSFYYVDKNEESNQRFALLLSQLDFAERTIQDIPVEWLDLSSTIGEAYELALSSHQQNKIDSLNKTLEKLNIRFQDFLDRCYWQMFTLAGTRRPLVVTRVLDYLRAQPEEKKALVVVDGMNVWQLQQVASVLAKNGLAMKTNAIFSYLPSITAWSRQALFRGSKPDLNVGTEVEQTVFSEYWKARGYVENQICYIRFSRFNIPDPSSIVHADIAGLVCTDLDDLMHAALLGNSQLYTDTETWIKESGIVTLIMMLKTEGFRCYITSDHGNIEAKGIGNLPMNTRCLSNSRSKRHIEFATSDLAEAFIKNNQHFKAACRNSVVYLRDTSAFTNEPLVVTHGGSHLLEMLVPFGVIE